jgi:hypothetical protein
MMVSNAKDPQITAGINLILKVKGKKQAAGSPQYAETCC